MREEVGRAIGLSARKVQVRRSHKISVLGPNFHMNDLDLVSGVYKHHIVDKHIL